MTEGVRCEECNKEVALALEGTLWLYCPRCHHYQRIVASTVTEFSSPSEAKRVKIKDSS